MNITNWVILVRCGENMKDIVNIAIAIFLSNFLFPEKKRKNSTLC
jgi:hypothetical protein